MTKVTTTKKLQDRFKKLDLFKKASGATQADILEGNRFWVSFNCGYGQEMVSYTPAEFFQAINSQWNDSKYDLPSYLAGDDSPFGKWTTNARWFNNYYECREYTSSMQD
tara:strand:- start:344 stop:670 length:327 start_codon:yes stop_codon:yes gene_type:complete